VAAKSTSLAPQTNKGTPMLEEHLSQDRHVEPLRFLSASEVRDIASQFGTPTFVYDLKTLEERYGYFAGLSNAFGLTIRYSVKANPNRSILRAYDRLGASFDVSSVWEARRVVAAGINPAKVLLTAQEASDGWQQLCERGMEFDAGSLKQLDDFGKTFAGGNVSVRFNPGFGSGLVKKLTSGGSHSSFGIWHEDLDQVVAIARRHGLHVKRLHFHIGSGHESSVLEQTVALGLQLCDEFPEVEAINLGGGYRIAAFLSDQAYDHRAMAERIREQIASYARRSERKLRLELEPGTYLMSLAGSLVSRVIDVAQTGRAGYQFIKIDAGVTEILRPSYYGSLHPLVSIAEPERRRTVQSYMVSGHCCIAGDSLTTVAGNTEDFTPVALHETRVGDLLVIERSGGYAASMCMKNFNSYPEAAEVFRLGIGKYELIRRRQTLEQMLENEIDTVVPIAASIRTAQEMTPDVAPA
jgi:diaminopimelate decarboxylase